MDNEDHIQLPEGTSRQITLPGRGAIGLQLYFEVSTPGIVDVQRQAGAPDTKNKPNDIGGPIPVTFEVTALQPGHCVISFLEKRPWEKDFAPVLRKRLVIEVLPSTASNSG